MMRDEIWVIFTILASLFIDFGVCIRCYVCMSNNVPPRSVEILSQTLNIPVNAQSAKCSDPFDSPMLSTTSASVLVQDCKSACIKMVTDNKYLRVTIRGCLGELYRDGYLNFPLPENTASYLDSCDVQRQESHNIDVVTDTCICTKDFCNVSSKFYISAVLLFSAAIASMLFR